MSKPNLTDIEELVKIWAWDNFVKTRSKENSKIKLDEILMDVKWDRVKFINGPPEFSDERKLEKPNSQVVFRSTYENWTDKEQEHSFQTERTTVSCCTTSINQGYSKGFNLELKLGLPDEVAGATAGFGREVNMESVEENSQEESMTWSINSTIKVPPKHKTTAELVVREQEYNAIFKMSVTIKGRILVVLTNLKENNCFVQSLEGNISDILKKHGDQTSKNYVIEGKTVVWEVIGKCKFRFGIEQHVQLRENSLAEN